MPDDDDDSKKGSPRKGAEAAGRALNEAGVRQLEEIASRAGADSARNTNVPSYKRGGKVRKSGPALLHRGEKVRSGKRKKGRSKGKRMSGRY